MTGYQCPTCRWLGTDPDLHRELDKVDDGAARYVVVESCPDCGADELLEVALCVYCQDCGVDAKAEYDDMCKEHAIQNDWDFNVRRDLVQLTADLTRKTA